MPKFIIEMTNKYCAVFNMGGGLYAVKIIDKDESLIDKDAFYKKIIDSEKEMPIRDFVARVIGFGGAGEKGVAKGLDKIIEPQDTKTKRL
jgi:hypothetical protein